MPGVKRFGDMREKYELKYDGANVTTALTAVEEIKNRRYEAFSSPIVNIIETVRPILEANGVPAGQHGIYYAFAQVIQSKAFSHSGATLDSIIAGKKSEWITAHKADPTILDKIILAIIGTLPPY